MGLFVESWSIHVIGYEVYFLSLHRHFPLNLQLWYKVFFTLFVRRSGNVLSFPAPDPNRIFKERTESAFIQIIQIAGYQYQQNS